ncbi:hypothetical protein KUTeg_017186 [Tegillarca granosa]|uniref:Uncharacterized protein n=1 Tax=Tegillarca granosa TaxID=220873 RepID=A0ABQ9ERS5_TEGGR|nr:hypothetical protein KUTeg_017186 [Tegillarca granosa]
MNHVDLDEPDYTLDELCLAAANEETCNEILLLKAIEENDIETVRRLFTETDVSPNFVLNGRSPICRAAHNGRDLILDILIQQGCNLTTPDFTDSMWQRQPIHIAASKRHLRFVQKLIENGVDVNSRDSDQRTALHWVAIYGFANIAEYLLSVGGCVNIAQVDGFTPLHAASCLGHDELCKLLISNNVDLNRTDRDGWTTLHTAVCHGHINVVKALLDAGASLTRTTFDEENVLHIAVCKGHFEIYRISKYLVKKGAEIQTENTSGITPLYLAAMRTDESFMLLLYKAGYNFSKEKWIHENCFPSAVVQNEKLCNMLKSNASNARKLKDICCFKIRKLMGRNCIQSMTPCEQQSTFGNVGWDESDLPRIESISSQNTSVNDQEPLEIVQI